MPAAQHPAISTWAREAHHSEQCATTWRQRVARLVREALAFPTQLATHMGASRLFIGHDHLTRAAG
jgi:serine acetyltransferase